MARVCEISNIQMVFYRQSQVFRYPKKACNKKTSLRSNSFFWKSKLPISKILLIGCL
ncbi:hypothetical protein MXB_5683 [Myxobolus squamalis]|nr:hypothetical protein MXB_5683 [Myxobolus squamalis]